MIRCQDVLMTAYTLRWHNLRELLPSLVVDALQLPKPLIPQLSLCEAVTVSKQFYPKRVEISVAPTRSEFEWAEAVVRDFPHPKFYWPLAFLLYRNQEFGDAIEACNNALGHDPIESDGTVPSPGPISIFAMYHLRIGNMDQTNKYRQQLTALMKQKPVKDKVTWQGFAKEVDAVLSKELENDGADSVQSATGSDTSEQ